MPIVNPKLTINWLTANSKGKGVEVAVIDSGIDVSHPVLKGKVKRACVVQDRGAGKIIYKEIPPNKSEDSFGHGSAVAGIILDIAPKVELISVKVLGENNTGSGEALIAGLRWALDKNIKLINMSLATSKQKFAHDLFDLCERAYVQNAILIVSKRNFGDLGYPAMFSSVISVDSEPFKDKYKVIHYLKNRIQYGARGYNVKVLNLQDSYTIGSGTSFATPHVTGMAALLISVFPDISSYQVKTVLDTFSLKLFNKNI